MKKINKIHGRKILDSRGNPTLEVIIELDDNSTHASSVPQGASTGRHEAKTAISGDGKDKHKNIEQALVNLSEIDKVIRDKNPEDQKELDKQIIEKDATENKSKLGANVILATSIALAKAGCHSQNMPLWKYISQISESKISSFPTPLANMIEGGLHANNSLDFQEFLITPARNTSFEDSLSLISKIYHALRKYLIDKKVSTLSADEGGFAPHFNNNENALKTLKFIIENQGLQFARELFLGIDAAANSFHTSVNYHLTGEGTQHSRESLVDYYSELINSYNLIYLEDPFEESDYDGWRLLSQKSGQSALIVGDDLTATNPDLLQKASNEKLINGVIIKPIQIGTVTETIAVSLMAQKRGITRIVSHRSGETEDYSIADIAVGLNAEYVKFGAPARERSIKYNRLLKIRAEMATDA